jgi:membrane associated rhomboid family serine protease
MMSHVVERPAGRLEYLAFIVAAAVLDGVVASVDWAPFASKLAQVGGASLMWAGLIALASVVPLITISAVTRRIKDLAFPRWVLVYGVALIVIGNTAMFLCGVVDATSEVDKGVQAMFRLAFVPLHLVLLFKAGQLWKNRQAARLVAA